jgi:hypothetical protein
MIFPSVDPIERLRIITPARCGLVQIIQHLIWQSQGASLAEQQGAEQVIAYDARDHADDQNTSSPSDALALRERTDRASCIVHRASYIPTILMAKLSSQ